MEIHGVIPTTASDAQVDATIVDRILKQGVVERASILCFVTAIGYFVYGFTSIDFLSKYDSSITLKDSLLRRFFLNALPSFLLGMYLRSKTDNPTKKIIIWSCLSQLIYVAAFSLYVWPIMLKGQTDIYLYVHGVNTMYICISAMMVGTFPAQLLFLLCAMTISLWIPTALILLHFKSMSVFSLFINDMSLFTVLAFVGGYLNYLLRRNLITESLILAKALSALESANETEKNQVHKIAKLEKDKAESLEKKGLQIHHDIRNPLDFLNMRVALLKENDSTQTEIKNDISRIQDIINELISQENNVSKPKPELLSSLIEIVISETRIRFREKNLKIEFQTDQKNSLAFSKVSRGDFVRAISNIVCNSAEATPENGTIHISLKNKDRRAFISIEDHGEGIPKDVLPQIFNRNFSYGKTTDSSIKRGLGLSQAKEAIESLGGKIDVSSDAGKGTNTHIELPIASRPSWYVRTLILRPSDTLVIVVDHDYIHDSWESKVSRFNSDHSVTVSTLHFKSPQEFKTWFKTQESFDFQLLIDLEFQNNENTDGLTIIENLDIASHSFLVTHRWNENKVQESCSRLHIGMIPKSAISNFSLMLAPKNPRAVDIVVIDDDISILAAFKKKSESLGKSILTFSSIDSFLRESRHIDLNTEIRVDSDLGADTAGEIDAERIFQLGFKNIYCTSYNEALNLNECPWIKGRKQKDIL